MYAAWAGLTAAVGRDLILSRGGTAMVDMDTEWLAAWKQQLQLAFPDTVFGDAACAVYPGMLRGYQDMGVRSRSVEVVVARVAEDPACIAASLRDIVADAGRHGEVWTKACGRALVLLTEGPPAPAIVPSAKRFCARFSSAWHNGVLVVQASNIVENPHLAEVAFASALSSWRAHNHRHEGASDSGPEQEALNCVGHLIADEVATYQEMDQDIGHLAQAVRQCASTLSTLGGRCDGRIRELRNAAAYTRALVDIGGADPRQPLDRLTEEQEALVGRALEHLAAPGARLRSEDINKGAVEALSKYSIDKHFGTFTKFRETVERRARVDPPSPPSEQPP